MQRIPAMLRVQNNLTCVIDGQYHITGQGVIDLVSRLTSLLDFGRASCSAFFCRFFAIHMAHCRISARRTSAGLFFCYFAPQPARIQAVSP